MKAIGLLAACSACLFLAVRCQNTPAPGIHTMPSPHYHATAQAFGALPYREKAYVPVYSEIYAMNGEKSMLLTSILSVRNTSLRDTVYIATVDYYDSHGRQIRRYLDRTVALYPLESVEFLVEYQEKEGGPGANFIVDWGMPRRNMPKPIIQAVMIGAAYSQGISFVTESHVIEVDTSVVR